MIPCGGEYLVKKTTTDSIGRLVNTREAATHEPGLRGEIFVRGPRLMSGYFNNPKATADSFVDGWLKTGDIGVIDKRGRVFIVDRQKVRDPR